MRFAFLATSFLATYAAQAQVPASSYTFSAAAGTYTDITGTAGLVALPATFIADNVTSTAIPVGFTFYYCGTAYTQVAACTNGWLSFNAATTSTASGNSTGNLTGSAASNVKPALMPLWDDLKGHVDSASAAAYVTTGTAPNRVFTFQWKNWMWSRSGAVNISFQVKLYETSNIVEYIYKQEAGAGSPSATSGATIGIADGTATPGYLTLNNSTAAPAASSSAFTTNITTRPANGQVYRFRPIPMHDISADSILIASTFCPNSSQPVSVRLKNNGTTVINTVDIYWSVDGILQPVVAYAGTPVGHVLAAPANRQTVVLGNVPFPTAAPRNIKVWTFRPNGMTDEVPANDTVSRTATADRPGVVVRISPRDTAICNGAQVTFDAGTFPGSPIYIWSTGSVNHTINVDRGGRFIVKVQNDSGCSGWDTVSVTMRPDPAVNAIAVIDNNDMSFTFNAINARDVNTYEWDFGDGSAPATGSGLPPQVIHAYAAGEYTITLKLKNDCKEILVTKKVKVAQVTGIDELSPLQRQVKLFPNPAQGMVHISCADGLKVSRVELYELSGRRTAVSGSLQIDVSRMAAGLYQAVIVTDKGKVLKKLEVRK